MAQHKDESAAEYMRRIVSNINHEYETYLDGLPTIAAVVEFFELWDVYDTDLLVGVHQGIAEGDDPAPLRAFIRKYKLDRELWLPDEVMRAHRESKKAAVTP